MRKPALPTGLGLLHLFVLGAVGFCGELEVGPAYVYLDYRETINLSDFGLISPVPARRVVGTPSSTEYGPIVGLNFQYFLSGKHVPIVLNPQLMLLLGTMTYDGSTQEFSKYDSTLKFEPARFRKSNLFLSPRLLAGYAFTPTKWAIEFGAGVSASYWNRQISALGGEHYYWFGIPLYVRAAFLPMDRLKITGLVSLAPMFAGYMKPYFSLYASMLTDATYESVKLGNKLEFMANLEVEARINRILGISVGPFFQTYRFGRSDVGLVTGPSDHSYRDTTWGKFIEPASKTRAGGARLRVVLHVGAKSIRTNGLFGREEPLPEPVETHDAIEYGK